jgi:hypothetical protein
MRSRADDGVVIFAGPTLAASARASAVARRYRVRPPVRRGDVAGLVAARARPGVLVLVDGLFHDTLAVGHAEIREAIGRGWQVWGLSSMGAIRAREMGPLGVRGYGEVFERFLAEDDFQDDEVALLHERGSPYRALTEPLVHLRVAIDHLVARRIIVLGVARAVLRDLKSRWYGERTREGTVRALTRRAPRAAATIREELASFDRFRIKTRDLERFLQEGPWMRRALTSEGEMRTTAGAVTT